MTRFGDGVFIFRLALGGLILGRLDRGVANPPAEQVPPDQLGERISGVLLLVAHRVVYVDRWRSPPVLARPSHRPASGPRCGDRGAASLLVRQMGGAVARTGAHESAFCARDTAYALLLLGTQGLEAHGEALLKALAPWTGDHRMPNFTFAAAGYRDAYDAPTLARHSAESQH